MGAKKKRIEDSRSAHLKILKILKILNHYLKNLWKMF